MADEATRAVEAILMVAEEPVEPHLLAELLEVAPARVEELAAVLPHAGRVTFRRLSAGLPTRLDVIVRFLALLELYKQGLVDLDQAVTFGDLEVQWTGTGAHQLAVVDSYDG